VGDFSPCAKRGVEAALLSFRKANPACGAWISGLGWEDVGAAAVARAESKAIFGECLVPVLARKLSSRL
jgi:hypothetical protein